MNIWTPTTRADWRVSRLADRHYSRQTPGSRQFTPPGQVVILFIPHPTDSDQVWAGWAWHRPFPGKAKRYDGYDGWYNNCFFRNESPIPSSILIQHAYQWVLDRWEYPEFGFDTYVWLEKIRSTNPGYCYQMAGWVKDGWSKDKKKRRLYLPVEKLC